MFPGFCGVTRKLQKALANACLTSWVWLSDRRHKLFGHVTMLSPSVLNGYTYQALWCQIDMWQWYSDCRCKLPLGPALNKWLDQISFRPVRRRLHRDVLPKVFDISAADVKTLLLAGEMREMPLLTRMDEDLKHRRSPRAQQVLWHTTCSKFDLYGYRPTCPLLLLTTMRLVGLLLPW